MPLGRRRLLRRILLIVCAVPLGLVMLYRFAPPPVTPLMLIRLAQGHGIDKRWVSLSAISPELQKAVMAGEDAKFCSHHGFDWDAIGNAVDVYQDGGHVLGASTISMQTAKNLFLWPGRDFLRKGLEAAITVMLETLWPKRRIMEVYLNVIEWGPGVYGAEAAARRYFHKPAAQLTHMEAVAMAAALPSPLKRDPTDPDGYVASYMQTISARMAEIPVKDGRICP